MSLMNIKNMKNEKGFTIVELLIVIVVIGILAAITIVAYNGVQARAKTTSASDAASKVAAKAEAYNAELSTYPLTAAALTGATSDKSYAVTGITVQQTALSPTPPASPNTVALRLCGSGSPATQSAITASNITGVQVLYYDYTNNTATNIDAAGVTSGGTVLCPVS